MSRVFRVETGRCVWIPPTYEETHEGLPNIDPEAILDKAISQASTIREKAKHEAALVVKDAKTKALECRRQAEKSGYEAGRKKGITEGLNQAQELVNQAKAVLEASKHAYDRYIEQVEPKFLALVLEVARKVIGESLAYDPELILFMMRQGLKAMDDVNEFTLRVNPKLVALIEGGKQDFQTQHNIRSIEVIGDDSVLDGVIVETSCGQIDATVDTQIENIAKAIGEARNHIGE